MRPALKRALRWLLTAAIIVLLVVFARTVNWHDAWHAVRSASPWAIAVAVLVNLLSLALKGVRWWIFLRPLDEVGLGLTMRATFAGAGLNNVLVANGGDAARVVFVARATGLRASRVLATMALERLFEALGYVMMLVAAAFVLPLPQGVARFRYPALALFVLALLVLVYLVRRPVADEATVAAAAAEVAGAKAPPLPFRARLRASTGRFFSTLSDVSTGPRVVWALVISALVWAAQIATYHLTAVAAHFPIPITGTVAALLAVNVGFMVRATPGNVGVFQLVYALTAVSFGLDRDAAIAVALLIQTLQIIPVTLIGVALAPEFVFRHRHVGEELAMQAASEPPPDPADRRRERRK